MTRRGGGKIQISRKEMKRICDEAQEQRKEEGGAIKRQERAEGRRDEARGKR